MAWLLVLPKGFFYTWQGLATVGPGPAQVPSATVVQVVGSWWLSQIPRGSPGSGPPPPCTVLEHSTADLAGTRAARVTSSWSPYNNTSATSVSLEKKCRLSGNHQLNYSDLG